MEGPVRHIPTSLVGALAIHVVVMSLLIWGLQSTPAPRAAGAPRIEVVKASIIDVQELERRREAKRRVEELARQKALEAQRRRDEARRRAQEETRQAELRKEQERQRREARRQRKLEQEKRRLAEKKEREEAELKKQAELKKKEAERKRREAEQRRRAKEAKRQEEARRRKAAQRKAEQERLAAAMAAEAAAIKAAEGRRRQRELAELTTRYVTSIAAKVERMWRRPPGAKPGDFCTVHVVQTHGGHITDVRLVGCRGDEKFRQSVRAAVLKADPLPPAPDPEVFDRELRFEFKPEG